MKSSAIFFIFLVTVCSHAQPLSIQWQKCLGGTLGDIGCAIKQTSDGGYYLGSKVISNDGDVSGNHLNHFDYWIAKLDSIGNLEWQKCYGGSAEDYLSSIQLNSEKGFIMAGIGGSTDGDIIGMHVPTDYWVINCDSTGDIIWQKCLGGTSSDAAYKIIKSYNNGYLVFGLAESSDFDVVGQHDSSICSMCSDAWLVKLDSVGNLLWSKCYGGSLSELGFSIVQTADSGNVLLSSARSNDGDVQGIHNDIDYWVVKIDSVGNIQWQKCLGGTLEDTPNDIIQTRDGEFIITGTSYSTDGDVTGHHGGWGNKDVWIVKLDSIGDIQWEKSLGGTDDDLAKTIIQLDDNGFLALCYTYSIDGDLAANPPSLLDVWIVRLDQTGNILWQQCLGGSNSDAAYDMQLTTDGGVILIGSTNSNDGDVSGNHGDYDVWVVKLAPLPDQVSESNPIKDFSTSFNPTSSNLQINFYSDGNENCQMKLMDITGRIILNQKIFTSSGFNEQKIHVGQHARGIYLVELETGNGSVTKKIMMN